jgi:hypothetical protein
MDAVALLRQQLKAAHDLLEATVGDPTPEQVHYLPQGRALPLGAAYAHVIFVEDLVVQRMLKGAPTFYESANTVTGASEPMPDFTAGQWDGYAAWTKRVRIDLTAMRSYAQQVYAASEAYLATLSDADLDQARDLGMGEPMSVASVFSSMLISHTDCLTGEISAVKGLQGLQGYPF